MHPLLEDFRKTSDEVCQALNHVEAMVGENRHVYYSRSDVRGDYLLRGRLYDFQEIDGKILAARVAFYFELHDNKAGSIVWSRYYSHDEPVDGKNVTAVVES